MKKKVGIYISKCLKSAVKNRRANQTVCALIYRRLLYLSWEIYIHDSHILGAQLHFLHILPSGRLVCYSVLYIRCLRWNLKNSDMAFLQCRLTQF